MKHGWRVSAGASSGEAGGSGTVSWKSGRGGHSAITSSFPIQGASFRCELGSHRASCEVALLSQSTQTHPGGSRANRQKPPPVDTRARPAGPAAAAG